MICPSEYESYECENESADAIEGRIAFSEDKNTNCKGLLPHAEFSNQVMHNSDSGSLINDTSQYNL